MGKRERAWLDLDTVEAAMIAARAVGAAPVAAHRGGFGPAFRRAGGDPDALGTHAPTGQPWRERRNHFVARHMEQVRRRGEPLWRDGRPTPRHLALAVWAYSPSPARLRRWLGVD